MPFKIISYKIELPWYISWGIACALINKKKKHCVLFSQMKYIVIILTHKSYFLYE